MTIIKALLITPLILMGLYGLMIVCDMSVICEAITCVCIFGLIAITYIETKKGGTY